MKKIIFVILNVMLVTFSLSQDRFNDVSIIESSSNFLVLEFSPIYDSVTTKTVDNVDYQIYKFANNVFNEREHGSPGIASRFFTIGLPSVSGNSIEMVSTSFESIRGINYLSIPYYSNEDDSIGYTAIYKKDDKYYQTNSFYPENMVELLNIGVARDRVLGTVKISPLQYNPITGELKKYSRIRVKINFNGNNTNNNLTNDFIKDDILKDIILNYNQSSSWVVSSPLRKRTSVDNSVLSTGNFYKIEIKESGIYKLDATFFRNANIDMANVDPRTIRIYGNGGAELSEDPENIRFTDPVECAIYAVGEDDGVFNNNDHFLFYGESPNVWVYDGNRKKYRHFINHYSTSNYYFLTFGGTERGKRVSRFESDKESNPVRATNLSSKYFIEPEQTNVNASGRQWYSRPIMSSNPSANFQSGTLDGILSSEPILYRTVVAGSSTYKLSFELFQNNNSFGILENIVDVSSGYQTCRVSDTIEFSQTSSIIDNRLNFRLEFRPQSIADVAYLDWIEIFYKRSLSTNEDLFQFYTPDDNNSYEYNLSGFSNSNILVFDVTEHNNVKLLSNANINASNISFQKKSSSREVSEIIVVGEKGYRSVSAVSKIVNSNLHGIVDGADYVVVCPNDVDFLSVAESYKSFRESSKKNPLRTIVVNLDQIYNEYSSGKVDPSAIRNFLRYALDNWTIKPGYVMLFGDGSYDYRNIMNNSNFSRVNRIPVWETKESNHAVDSYSSDDFFVRLVGNDLRVDMSIGRLTVGTSSEARNCIDKIMTYENSLPDVWRNKITFVADDGFGSGDEGSQFTDDSERLATYSTPKQFNLNKIYIVKYQTVVGVSGRTKPDAVVDIIKAFNDGTLLVNYIGHGNAGVWTHEGVFRNEITLPQLTNNGKYPLVVAATCGFGKYDDVDVQSGAELLLIQRNSGAIAVFAASRAVYVYQTSNLNSDLFGSLFLAKIDGSPFSLGEVMFRSKQGSYYDDNGSKFHVMGDPAIVLNIPYNISEIDTINGEVPSVTNVVNLKALNKVKLNGFIRNRNNTLRPDYNGKVNVTVYDAPKQERIVDGVGIFIFETDGGITYSGTSSIRNGKFETEFYVPKDISYEDRTGKISMYFDNGSTDGFGYNSYFKIVGSQSSTTEDTDGPVINLYLNDRNFRNGDLVSESPMLIVDLFDESGINTTELGVGHRFEAFLNNSNNGISLSSHYKGQIDSYKEGTAEYKFENLPNGNHKIKVKVFDVFNNPSSKEISFKVENRQSLSLTEVMNYPNPFSQSTKFTFNQNQDDPVDVYIKIYTVAGRLIKVLNEYGLTSRFVQIPWDGRDEDGDELANGVYLYKVILKTFDGKMTEESFGKLSILK